MPRTESEQQRLKNARLHRNFWGVASVILVPLAFLDTSAEVVPIVDVPNFPVAVTLDTLAVFAVNRWLHWSHQVGLIKGTAHPDSKPYQLQPGHSFRRRQTSRPAA